VYPATHEAGLFVLHAEYITQNNYFHTNDTNNWKLIRNYSVTRISA